MSVNVFYMLPDPQSFARSASKKKVRPCSTFIAKNVALSFSKKYTHILTGAKLKQDSSPGPLEASILSISRATSA